MTQPAPSPEHPVEDPRIQAVGVLLNTSALLERFLGAAIQREAGISHSVFEVLLILSGHPGGAPVGRLCEQLVLTSGGATRLVDRMVEAGLVTREPSAEDRRVQLVLLTEQGERTLRRAAAAHTRELDRVLADALAPGQAAAMVEGLDLLGRRLREELPPLR
ncbi:MarR family winged helix-turn-helix transcriptional regulator [Kitasatospora viridis]|uniref:DNA-binding MarR family transcriptional regulator n=1 Tax=Kitasatospora viridis TaxID=281105 RepID=A0A561UPD5_9ACTN|nr:MarR family transcriptional regulator [Kitasatospora viridis]TWG01237.1 DNA-binding MarR family transcriptional regulator [Kitasatospora viridis]